MKKQKDGRYRTSIKVGETSEGKPILKWISGKTKKELDAAREETRKAYITGNAGERREILFEVFAQEWYDAYKKPTLSMSSRQNYAAIFNVHMFPVFAGRQMRAITAIDLQNFMNGLAGRSKSTIDKAYMITKQVFIAAYAQAVIDRDPSLLLKKPTPKQQQPRRALTSAETAAVLNVGNEHDEGLMLLLLYYTGARIGEVLGLQWGDIGFDTQSVIIQRDIDFKAPLQKRVGNLKNTSSYRTIPLATALKPILEQRCGESGQFILTGEISGACLSERTLRRKWSRLMEAIYISNPTIEHRDDPYEERPQDDASEQEQQKRQVSILTPHYFRHNFASLLYNAGVDVLVAQKWLGHNDIKTTLATYSHLSKEKEQADAARLDAAFTSAHKPVENLNLPETCQSERSVD